MHVFILSLDNGALMCEWICKVSQCMAGMCMSERFGSVTRWRVCGRVLCCLAKCVTVLSQGRGIMSAILIVWKRHEILMALMIDHQTWQMASDMAGACVCVFVCVQAVWEERGLSSGSWIPCLPLQISNLINVYKGMSNQFWVKSQSYLLNRVHENVMCFVAMNV